MALCTNFPESYYAENGFIPLSDMGEYPAAPGLWDLDLMSRSWIPAGSAGDTVDVCDVIAYVPENTALGCVSRAVQDALNRGGILRDAVRDVNLDADEVYARIRAWEAQAWSALAACEAADYVAVRAALTAMRDLEEYYGDASYTRQLMQSIVCQCLALVHEGCYKELPIEALLGFVRELSVAQEILNCPHGQSGASLADEDGGYEKSYAYLHAFLGRYWESSSLITLMRDAWASEEVYLLSHPA